MLANALYWLIIHFRKVLTLFLWKMKKVVKILIVFFSPKNLSLIELLTNTLKALVSMTILNNTRISINSIEKLIIKLVSI